MTERTYHPHVLTWDDETVVLDEKALAHIETAADAATPGRWKIRTPGEHSRLSYMPNFIEAPNAHPERCSAGIEILGDIDEDYLHRDGDMEFITTVQPAVAKALVAEIRRLRAQ